MTQVRRHLPLLLLLMLFAVFAAAVGLVGPGLTRTEAMPSFSSLQCSACHPDDTDAGSPPVTTISVTVASETGVDITYDVSGSDNYDSVEAWAVLDPSTVNVARGSGPGSFTLPKDGDTYRVYWVDDADSATNNPPDPGKGGSAFQDITTPSQPAPTPTFGDVPSSHWAWAYIEALYSAGITSGCATTPLRYCPNDAVTRAQMAASIMRALGVTAPPQPTVDPFPDVPRTHWAAGFIKALADAGITAGYPDGTYRPNNTVSRAEMAAFIIRALGEAPVEPPTGTEFSDVPASHWAAGYIERLAQLAITTGYPDGTYRPNNSAARAEMAAFIVRAWSLPMP